MERLLMPLMDYDLYKIVEPDGTYDVYIDCDYARENISNLYLMIDNHWAQIKTEN
jgi:hypothetical protein